MTPNDKHRLRWYQFRLRSLLLLMFVIVLGLVAWRTLAEPYQAHVRGKGVITKLGGRYQSTAAPAWQRRLYGEDYQHIVLVDLADHDRPNEFIDAIADLPYLETLAVGGQDFTDEHLQRLRRAKQLRNLVLDTTSVTEPGVDELLKSHAKLVVYESQRLALLGGGRRASLVTTLRGLDGNIELRICPAHTDLREQLGQDFFVEAQIKNPRSTHVTISTAVKTLKAIFAREDPVTDVGLAQLKVSQQLRQLDLFGSHISNDALVHLKKLPSLRVLSLVNTHVDDAGMVHLKDLTGLQSLQIDQARITDRGLAELRHLSSLKELSLKGIGVTYAGLAHLKDLTHLERLSLDQADISDANLAHFSGLSNLISLSLDDTQVSDEGLAHLKGLTKLRWLWVRRTGVTEAGAAELSQALPNCLIFEK